MSNIQPLFHSAIDLDKSIAVSASKSEKRNMSLLQHLNNAKDNGLTHKKGIHVNIGANLE